MGLQMIDTPSFGVLASLFMGPVPENTECFISKMRLVLLLLLLGSASLAAGAAESTPIQTVYIIPSSHWDLGFLRPPDAEKEAMKPHLDAVMAACEADPEFRWTIESVWQLEAWLERTKDEAQIKRMENLLSSGQIELSAATGSMHTEFMGAEELNRLVVDGREVERRFSIHPTVAMMNDVPGFSIRLPQVLARSGIRYLITGSNTALGGGVQLWPGQEPFYWRSPDGSEVLTWQTQSKNGGYTEGMTDFFLAPDTEDPYLHTKFYPKEWEGLSNLEIMQRGIDKLVKQYDDAGNRQSTVAVLFMHDGIGPEYELKGLLPGVRAWNAAGRQPRLVVANPTEFFAHLEAQGRVEAPLYSGDWASLWAEVKLNSPAMSADARFLQERLPEIESLWSILTMEHEAQQYPRHALASDYDALFNYDEHNGAGQGGWPKVMSTAEVHEQNQEYSDKLRGAVASERSLERDGILQLAARTGEHEDRRMLLVYNPRSWQTTRQVRLPKINGDWQVRDAESGAVVPTQHLGSGELLFEARDLPSLGYRTYWMEATAARAEESEPAMPSVIESPYYRIELNPATGQMIRITDLLTHRVLLDDKEGGRAGQLMRNDAPFEEFASARPVVLRRERGAVVDQVTITRPGSLWPQTVIALPQHESQILLSEELDRSKMRLVSNAQPRDLYAFAFDFSFQGRVQRWVDDGEGLYRFPDELLPGARSDAVVPRHTLVWSDESAGSSYRLMLAQKEAFYDRYHVRVERPTNRPSTEGVEADVMIKVDQAETRDQGITSFDTYEPEYPSLYHFSFALRGEAGKADPVIAQQFEVHDDSEYIEVPAHRRPARWAASLVSLSASNVVMEVLRPSLDGNPDDYLLRLQEIAGKPAELNLKFPLPLRSIAETTLTEDVILHSDIQANSIHLSPHQTLSLRLSVAHKKDTAVGDKH